MTGQSLHERIEAVAALAGAIRTALAAEVAELGFEAAEVAIAPHTDAEFRLEADPASGQTGLVGVWRDARGNKFGELVFHAGGAFFVEHDVVRVHPREPRWFVEAVIAWGRDGTIKTEARLLPVAS